MAELRVVTVKSAITLRPNPLRHPILWWRLRHLRADLREQERWKAAHPVEADILRQIDEKMERQFLFGDDDG